MYEREGLYGFHLTKKDHETLSAQKHAIGKGKLADSFRLREKAVAVPYPKILAWYETKTAQSLNPAQRLLAFRLAWNWYNQDLRVKSFLEEKEEEPAASE